MLPCEQDHVHCITRRLPIEVANALSHSGYWLSKSRSEPDHLLSIYGNETTQNWPCKCSLQVVIIRARLTRFFWADTDVSQFSFPIPIFLYYSSSIYFTSWGKITTPGAVLPSAKHFQTTAERHYSVYFSSGHINKENNFTSYNYFMRQDIYSWIYFATSWTWLAELVTWQVWTAWLS